MTWKQALATPALGLTLILAACESGDIPRGQLIEAKFISCQPITSLLNERVGFWRRELERIRHTAVVQDGWEAELPAMVKSHPGVLLSIEISQSAWISSQFGFGKPKSITIGPLEETVGTRVVFSNDFGADCSNYPVGNMSYPVGNMSYYLVGAMGRDRNPPTHLADFLGVDTLMRPPQVFYEYLPREWRHARHRGSK